MVPAPFLQGAARPERHRTRRCGTRSPRSWASGCSWGCPASASTPSRSSSRPQGAKDADSFPEPHEYLRSLRRFVGRRTGDGVLLGEVNLPFEQQLDFFGGADGDELTMQFDFVGMQALYLSLARADAGPIETALAGRPELSPDTPVGHVRAQPRRAHPRQALRRRAAGGLRRLRPRRGHAALRARAAPPAAADARRRPAPDPDGLQPAVLAARHAGAVLRRGDRHGREPRRRRPARRPDADAVDRRAQRRLLHRRPGRPARPGRRGRLRPGVRQRGRPAPRPGLAAVVHEAADPPVPGVARARVGPLPGAGPGLRPGARARLPLGRRRAGRRPQPRGRAAEGALLGAGLRLVGTSCRTCWRSGSTPVGDDGGVQLSLDGYGYRWLRVVTEDSRRLL